MYNRKLFNVAIYTLVETEVFGKLEASTEFAIPARVIILT